MDCLPAVSRHKLLRLFQNVVCTVTDNGYPQDWKIGVLALRVYSPSETRRLQLRSTAYDRQQEIVKPLSQ